MAKREHGAPGRCAIIAALLCIALGALTACGRKEEPEETQLGIDGYVYVPRLLDTSAVDTYGNTYRKIACLKVLGNSLYLEDVTAVIQNRVELLLKEMH